MNKSLGNSNVPNAEGSGVSTSRNDIAHKAAISIHSDDKRAVTTLKSKSERGKDHVSVPRANSKVTEHPAADDSRPVKSEPAFQPSKTDPKSLPKLGNNYPTKGDNIPNGMDARMSSQPNGGFHSAEEDVLPPSRFQTGGFMSHEEENNLIDSLSNFGVYSGHPREDTGFSALFTPGNEMSTSHDIPTKPRQRIDKKDFSQKAFGDLRPLDTNRDTSTILIPATQTPTSFEDQNSFGFNPSIPLDMISSGSGSSLSSSMDLAPDSAQGSVDSVRGQSRYSFGVDDSSKASYQSADPSPFSSHNSRILVQDSFLFPSGDYAFGSGMEKSLDPPGSPFASAVDSVDSISSLSHYAPVSKGSRRTSPASTASSLAPISASSEVPPMVPSPQNSTMLPLTSSAGSMESSGSGSGKESIRSAGKKEKSKSNANEKKSNVNLAPSSAGSDATADKSDKPDYTLDLEALRNGTDKRTTLMIRNIPNKYTQLQFINELFNSGFRGKFDFLYLPIDVHNTCNIGYAFINMKGPAEVLEFYESWHGNSWPLFRSRKRCEITLARIQGQAALTTRFLNSPILVNFPLDAQPLIFHTSGPLLGQGQPLKHLIQAKSSEILVSDPAAAAAALQQHADSNGAADVIGRGNKAQHGRTASVSSVPVDADDPTNRHLLLHPHIHPHAGAMGGPPLLHPAGPYYEDPDAAYGKHMMGGKSGPDGATYPPPYRPAPGHAPPAHWRHAPYPYYLPPHDPHYDYYYPPHDPHMHPGYPPHGAMYPPPHRPHPVHPAHRGYEPYPGPAPGYGHGAPPYGPPGDVQGAYHPPPHNAPPGKQFPGDQRPSNLPPPSASNSPSAPNGKPGPGTMPPPSYYLPRGYPEPYEDYPGYYPPVRRASSVGSEPTAAGPGTSPYTYDAPGALPGKYPPPGAIGQRPPHGQYPPGAHEVGGYAPSPSYPLAHI